MRHSGSLWKTWWIRLYSTPSPVFSNFDASLRGGSSQTGNGGDGGYPWILAQHSMTLNSVSNNNSGGNGSTVSGNGSGGDGLGFYIYGETGTIT
jgi:hypothetical protein